MFFYLSITVIIILFLFSSISITFEFLKDKKSQELIIYATAFYGLFKYKIQYPLITVINDNKEFFIKITKESDKNINKEKKVYSIDYIFNNYKKAMKIANKYNKLLCYITNKISWKSLLWITEVGMEDAAVTGILTGLLNVTKSNVLVYLRNKRIYFKKIYLNIKPNFKSHILRTNISCIFSIKIGYIIIAGLKLIKIYLLKK